MASSTGTGIRTMGAWKSYPGAGGAKDTSLTEVERFFCDQQRRESSSLHIVLGNRIGISGACCMRERGEEER